DVDSDGLADYQFLVQGTSAPNLTLDMIPAHLGVDVTALHVGTLGLVLEPMASTLLELLGRERHGRVTMVDPNIRVGLMPDTEYRERLHTVLAESTIVKASDADLTWLYPDLSYKRAAERLLGEGVGAVVVTLGAQGAFAAHRDVRLSVGAVHVQVVDTIGAGDAFGASLLAWLHDHGALKPNLQGSERLSVGDRVRRRGRELAPVGQHHVDQPAARRIRAAPGFDDHRIHGVTVARDRPHVHPHPDAGDGEVTRGSRDEGGSREADRAGAQLGALVNVVHATEHVDVTDHVVAQRLRRRRARIHVEGVDAALPVQPDRIEVQPLPVDRDDLIGRQRTGEKVKAPQDRLVRGQVGDDPRVVLVRTESRVRHAPAGADQGRADLVDDAE